MIRKLVSRRLSSTLQKTLYYALFALVLAQAVLTSWVDEDAFITFRVVDNFVHGFGLRWNINERVQSYTNPLWMLLHIPIYAITGNIILTTCLLGWGCLVGTLLLARATFGSYLQTTALFLVPMLISTTNAAYFTSGLEGPLLNVLFAAFGFTLVRRPKHFWFWLSFSTAASAMTRLDAVILYAPIWTYLLHTRWNDVRIKEIILGGIPLAAWLLFSLFYYGFLLPNTAPAKLGGHLPMADYVQSGLAYAYDFMLADPWSAISIIAAILYFPYQMGKLRARAASPHALPAAIACGIWLFCMYVVYIGGAQLSLRMFSLPAFAVCWLWAWRFPLQTPAGYGVFALAAVLAPLVLVVPPEVRHTLPIIASAQIGGIPWAHKMFIKSGPSFYGYLLQREDMAVQPDRTERPLTVKGTNVIGNFGFYSGPYVIIIDPVGLSDPLLARLPAVDHHLIKVGDVFRYIPPGYEEAILTGSTQNLPPPLAQYYEKIQLITRGDLWDTQRIKTILFFNFGAYDTLRAQYIREFYPRKID